MGNMSYCRFQNTLRDLKDCYDADIDSLSEKENDAFKKLISLCRDFVEAYGDDDDDDDDEENNLQYYDRDGSLKSVEKRF